MKSFMAIQTVMPINSIKPIKPVKQLFAALTLMSASFLSVTLSATALADTFSLHSSDIQPGKPLTNKQVFNGFGCKGGNQSPQLEWKNAPAGTRSFAVTAYDPDAPTGSGWWHWVAYNIPASVTTLASNAGAPTAGLMPANVVQGRTDFGSTGFGGACPPVGHGVHRYQFTVHALKVEKLDLDANASAAMAGFMINANRIDKASIEATYQR